jgi:hypothetical protein
MIIKIIYEDNFSWAAPDADLARYAANLNKSRIPDIR